MLLVGTYWPWAQRERGAPAELGPGYERTVRPSGPARIRAVVRSHDGRVHRLTEVPALNAVGEARTRVSFGIKEKTGRGVSLLFPAVMVSVHL